MYGERDPPDFRPFNSDMESDSDEAPPAKKPRIKVNVASLTKGKITQSQDEKKTLKDHKRFLREKEGTNGEDAGLKDDDMEFKDNILMEYKTSQKIKEEPEANFSHLTMDEGNNINVADFKDDTDKENGFVVKEKVSQSAKEGSNARLARFLEMNEGDNMTDEDYKDNAKENKLAVKNEMSQNYQEGSKARLSRFIKMNDGDEMNNEDFEHDIDKKKKLALKKEVSQSDEGYEACLSSFLKSIEKDDINDGKNFFCKDTGVVTAIYSDSKNSTDLAVPGSSGIQMSHDDLAVPGTSGTQKPIPYKYPVRSDSESDIDVEEWPLQPLIQQIFPSHTPPLLATSASDTDTDGEVGPSRARNSRRPVGPYLGASDTDSETDGEEGSLAAIRKANIKRMKAIMDAYRDPELEREFKASNRKRGKRPKSAPIPKRKRGGGDSTFRFHGSIPTERRRSTRLQKENPQYTFDTLDEVTMKNTYFTRPSNDLDDSYEDLERVVLKPKRKNRVKRKTEEHIIIPVEDVTQEMLDNICLRVKDKVYSDNGTSCHQCRQKTMDQKTCCRNPECYGIYGMFCGVCIRNRYGEDAAEALLNPNWICPVCRGRCNCSICRTKQGKRPTGVLAPLAQERGYQSVDHYLIVLKGEGDRRQDDAKWKLMRDPEALLGFSQEGRKAHFQDGSSDFLPCGSCSSKDSEDPEKPAGCSKDDEAQELLGFTHGGRKTHFQDGSSDVLRCCTCAFNDCEDPDNLLGFSMEGEAAMMGGRREDFLFDPKGEFLSALDLKPV